MELVDFLRSRLDEDEAAARAVMPMWADIPFSDRFEVWGSEHSEADSAFVDRFDPDRVLREVESKRHVISMYEDACHRAENAPNADAVASARVARSTLKGVLTVMAGAYKGHPDYREDWAL